MGNTKTGMLPMVSGLLTHYDISVLKHPVTYKIKIGSEGRWPLSG